MDLTALLRSRRMTRSFEAGRAVAPEQLAALLKAAASAPSAGMTQGWDLVVLRDGAARERFWSLGRRPGGGGGHDGAGDREGGEGRDGRGAGDREGRGDDRWLAGMRTAPLLLVVLADPGAYARRYAAPDKRGRAAAERAREPAPWWLVDASMASLLVLLAAADAGLGACFFGVPPDRQDAVLRDLGASGRVLVGVVAVGTPAPHPHGPTARPRSPHRPARRRGEQVAHEGRLGVPLGATPPGDG